MENSKYTSNQNITVAIDCVIFGFDLKKLNLLLFKRRVNPFKGSWSLIGEVLENNVSLKQLHDVIIEEIELHSILTKDAILDIFVENNICFVI